LVAVEQPVRVALEVLTVVRVVILYFLRSPPPVVVTALGMYKTAATADQAVALLAHQQQEQGLVAQVLQTKVLRVALRDNFRVLVEEVLVQLVNQVLVVAQMVKVATVLRHQLQVRL
jgi:ABC-type siderophore export system fused ATPase/permease subunit